jgi:hypothetical protein
MIIGVIGFYFIISAINSYISESIKNKSDLSLNISKLYELKKEYQLSENSFQIVQNSLFQNDVVKDKWNFTEMLNQFPKSLKEELKYKMHMSLLDNFEFIKDLKWKLVIELGESFKIIKYKESNKINIFNFYFRLN